ncbi:hypothetical protein BH09ACT8_BH09ACT8_27270 [soil metagenome]
MFVQGIHPREKYSQIDVPTRPRSAPQAKTANRMYPLSIGM